MCIRRIPSRRRCVHSPGLSRARGRRSAREASSEHGGGSRGGAAGGAKVPKGARVKCMAARGSRRAGALPAVDAGRRRGRAARAPRLAPLGKLCERLQRRGRGQLAGKSDVQRALGDGAAEGRWAPGWGPDGSRGLPANSNLSGSASSHLARFSPPPRLPLPTFPTTQRPRKPNATMLFSCLRTNSRP